MRLRARFDKKEIKIKGNKHLIDGANETKWKRERTSRDETRRWSNNVYEGKHMKNHLPIF